jgi:hypothetical protein
MPIKAKFRVDPQITEVLGEGYRTSEQAIKELVDNAWDADAESIEITLPEPMTLLRMEVASLRTTRPIKN